MIAEFRNPKIKKRKAIETYNEDTDLDEEWVQILPENTEIVLEIARELDRLFPNKDFLATLEEMGNKVFEGIEI